ncbi:MAG: T9SS type A sorting domain-containing protein [Saprospiraceae bacterium]|nr:T9SS type A sorting domain-containing protein [Saprospiraceae bacterium]
MKKFFVSVFVVLTTFLTISAQQNSLKPNLLIQEAKKSQKSLPVELFKISKTRNDVNIPKEIESYSILDIDREGLKKFRKEKSNFISLTIPQEGRSDLTLELVEVQPFAEGFTVKTAPSMQIVEVNTGKHYRGIIKGQERSIAAISIFDDQIMGFISHPSATGNLVIGKLENSPEHILYQDDQISEKFNFDCQAKDKETEYTTDQLNGTNTGSRALSDCVRLYLEVDYDIYVNKGSTTTAVTNYITGIFNQVSTLYANEQINTVVSEIVVWTQQSPYNSTSSINMLNAFTANRQGFNGDLAQLLSYKASGGVAYVDGLCRSNPDYSMGYAGIQSSYSNVPTYSWTVEVCAHEFGHLFGSQHTHACVWNGNNTAIDGCYTTEGGCANPGNPPATVGGTIMSYCHLTSSGINFSNGFGVQPGNVIRSEVTAATCLQACSGGGGGGNQCTENVLSLEIRTDNYPTETTWNIKNSAGAILYSGGPYNTPNTLNTISLCLPSACYTFNIIDGYGDGICCAYGSGYYNIKQGTATLITGGQFGATETKSFCASGTSSNLTLSTSAASVSSAAGNATVGVTSNISWAASSNATTWCTVTPASGSNNGNLTVSYTANTSTSTRTATITVSGSGINRTYVLTQSGNTPTLTLSAATATATSAAGSNTVGVTSNISWTASSNATTWCTVAPASGSNNGNLTVSYAANTTTSARTATITVSGSGINRTYVLTQSGNTPELTLSAATATVTSAAGSNTVGITSNVSWTASSNATTWCTVAPASGSNNGNLTVSYAANTTTSARTATITVSGSGINRTYVLTQSGNTPELTLSAATATVTSAAGSNTVSVTSNISWTASSNATTWCTVAPASGSNNGNLTVSYTANTTTSARTATITVSGSGINRTYVLTQSGAQGPSCTDGIQNGQETGIDCGGPTCPACPPNNDVQITTLAGHYFETGWDGWTDGGVDCARVNTSSSPEGSFSIQLRDNDGEFSSMTSPVYNMSQFDSVTVEFKFRSTSFETNEDFWLRYYNGTTWNTVSAFTFPVNFANNVTYTRKIKLNGPLSSAGRFRFQADASDNTDVVYIDAIIIIGYKTNTQSTCTDGVKNGQETGIDCGGPTCPVCPPTCTDGVKNGQETGVDCGGPTCPSCPPTCTDGVKNGQETGVDCGGPTCPSCPPTCTDGIQNGQETGVDCGGPTCPSCLPTCTDGVKNGQETGVDCGGPTCPSCLPTCTDGVKNGQETGVDCGGPTCPVCPPTCTDGIQNGQETGVDCGGPCPACNTGGSVTTISGHYFETGWDGWIDGGSDCYRYDGPLSPEGIYSIRLRDNSAEQSGMSSPNYNLTAYNTVQIEFKFRANGMEAGEDFWVMYFNGSTWSNVGTFVSGTGFFNNQLYTATVTLTGSFSSASKFRFQCDASENDDEVYIDAVVIRAGTGSGSFENPIVITAENNTVEVETIVSGVQIFPNPATNMINVQSDEDVRRVNIYNIAGQLVMSLNSENIESIDISALHNGLYFVRVETEENVYTERLIKN